MNAVTNILEIILAYKGTGWLVLLYMAALGYLCIREKDAVRRTLFVTMPLVMLVLFLLPPVHALYTKIEDADTYYRVLWLIPMSATMLYAMIRLAFGWDEEGQRSMGFIAVALILSAVLIVLAGHSAYRYENVTKAENRLHLPSQVLTVADTITNDMGELSFVNVAAPPELVWFLRQYDARIRLAYGREMMTENWEYDYRSDVYDAYVAEPMQAADLIRASREALCRYVVVNRSVTMEGDPEAFGLVLVSNVDGYTVYRDPAITEFW